MRGYPAGLVTAINLPSQTLGWLLSITMPDGTVKRFNSFGTKEYTYPASGGNIWYGYPGFSVSKMRFTDGANPPSVDIDRGLNSSYLVTFTEAASGLIAGAPVSLYMGDYVNGVFHLMGSKWRAGKITTSRSGKATFSIVSLERRSQQLVLRRCGPGCKWKLGGYGCGKDLTAFTDSVTVVSSSDLLTVVVSGPSPARADDFYNLGAIKFTSGDNQGLSYDVRDWISSTGTLKLVNKLKRPVTAGDTATVHAGCDKSKGAAGCGRFSNYVNRLAHDELPDGDITWPVLPSNEPATTPEPSTTDGGGVWYGGIAKGGLV